MDEPASSLAAWETFYVIVGSSAAALTGLQFVVIALGAESKALSRSSIRAFASPTIVHFCAVLLVSVILSAPWHALSSAGLCIGACGAAGLAYTLTVIRQARRQGDYAPVFEDWLWHATLPLLAYGTLLVAEILFHRDATRFSFAVGTAVVLLLFIGIHNSWDAATYIAMERSQKSPDPSPGRDNVERSARE